MASASTIQFGNFLDVTDEGGGVIRVDACPPASVADGSVTLASLSTSLAWVKVQTGVPSTYTNPLVYDNTAVSGGLYGWDGAAYRKIGPL
jgi:hypothetical protein